MHEKEVEVEEIHSKRASALSNCRKPHTGHKQSDAFFLTVTLRAANQKSRANTTHTKSDHARHELKNPKRSPQANEANMRNKHRKLDTKDRENAKTNKHRTKGGQFQ